MFAPLLLLLLGFTGDSTTRTMMVPVGPAESLSVTEAGAGDPVVLIPGLFGATFEYRNVIPRLVATGARAIAVEPLGVGSSTRPPDADYSLAAQAARIARALDSIGVSHAIIVAHAVGSSIALRLALQRPDLVRGIVSLEGGVAESATTDGFRRAMKFAPLLKLGGVAVIHGLIKHELTEESGDPSWVTDNVVRGYIRGAAQDVGAALSAYQGMANSAEPDGLAPRLDSVRAPMLLLIGGTKHHGGPPPEEIALLAGHLGTFVADTIPGVGHFIQEETPARVASAVDSLRHATLHGGEEARR